MRTIRDDFAAYLKHNLGTLKPRSLFELRGPVYVTTNVHEDLQDVGASIFGTGASKSSAENIYVEEFLAQYWKPPHDAFWIEHAHKPTGELARISYLVNKVPPDPGIEWEYEITTFLKVHHTVIMLPGFINVLPTSAMAHPAKQRTCMFNVVSNKPKAGLSMTSEEASMTLSHSMFMAITFCNLLATKNVEVETVEPTPKELKAARRQKGKGAKRKPSSYRVLKIGEPPPHVMREENDREGSKKRRHQVRGHFRTYRHERYRPETRGTYWIRPHWRGDEKLGIVNVPIILKKGTDV